MQRRLMGLVLFAGGAVCTQLCILPYPVKDELFKNTLSERNICMHGCALMRVFESVLCMWPSLRYIVR